VFALCFFSQRTSQPTKKSKEQTVLFYFWLPLKTLTFSANFLTLVQNQAKKEKKCGRRSRPHSIDNNKRFDDHYFKL